MPINLTKEKMEESFQHYLEEIFKHPEITSAAVRDIVITRETMIEAGKQAFDAGFHDIYSDIDLSVRVCLPPNGSVTSEEYIRQIDRFGVSKDTALGWMFIPVNQMYRIIFKNGMRYDFGFEIENAGDEPITLEDCIDEAENVNWPLDNINRFWFIQIQALGKLYRKDYLISSHLANMNCNDTLVMQMVMRDLKHGTSHHRYGYAEEIEYIKDLGKTPYKNVDETFDRISDHLYAAALTYDKLAKMFYPNYQERSAVFFDIWDWYQCLKRSMK